MTPFLCTNNWATARERFAPVEYATVNGNNYPDSVPGLVEHGDVLAVPSVLAAVVNALTDGTTSWVQ